jgi:hypothetical protein
MSRAYETHWICLPEQVGEPVFDRVENTMTQADGEPQVVLDFSRTDHIDFRALHDFGQHLRMIEQVRRPIVVTGLNVYCGLIFRFALCVEDWDLFEEAGELGEPEGTGEGLPLRARVRGLKTGWAPWDFRSNPWVPHLN